jgi:hypothetical protein
MKPEIGKLYWMADPDKTSSSRKVELGVYRCVAIGETVAIFDGWSTTWSLGQPEKYILALATDWWWWRLWAWLTTPWGSKTDLAALCPYGENCPWNITRGRP